ncbi:MAG: hypothetical protein J6330_01735 [Clostridia bacterium]|nr:hypothetical protein [Clostridia bacterium]
MKEDMMRQAIGEIDDTLIEGAEKQQSTKRTHISFLKWGSIAAAFVLVIAVGVMVLPGMLKTDTPVVTPDTPEASGYGDGYGDPNYHGDEIGMYEKYVYSVDSGKYSSYVQGRVISDKNVGDKLENVTVTAGWVRPEGLPQAEKEHARAEIYEIKGVSTDTAVAIKFLDKLEAQTTDFYYVIMNPEADLTSVQPYVITYDDNVQYDSGEILE